MARSFFYISFLLIFSCDNFKNSPSFQKIVVPLVQPISTLDTAHAYDTISSTVVHQAYEQLYEYHYLKRPYSLRPLLAIGKPIIDKSGTRYTIKIKKNILYHDDPAFKGKKRFLKAQDFITQIKRLAYKPTKSNGWWLLIGKIKGINRWRENVASNFEKFKETPIYGLKAPDDHTLIIELTRPYPRIIYILAMSFTSPMPIEIVEFYHNNLKDRMVGTGPFKLQKWKKNKRLKIIRNKNYRKSYYPTQGDRLANSQNLLVDAGKEIPFLDKIEFRVLPKAKKRWKEFRDMDIDLIVLPKDRFREVVNRKGTLVNKLYKSGIRLSLNPTLTYWWLSFNMQDPLIGKNRNLRMAIAHAIDISRYIKKYNNSIGLKANSIYPPGIPGYNPSVKLPYKYDLEKAKQFLESAGYPNGSKLPEIVFDTTIPSQGKFVATQLKKIGINIKVSLNKFPQQLKKAKEGRLQFWQDGWALDFPDSENLLHLLATKNHPPGPNVTSYSNPLFDKYFEQIKLLSNGKNKFSLMRKMEEMVNKDLPWIMQYYARDYTLYHSHLKNLRPSDLIYNHYKYIRVLKK